MVCFRFLIGPVFSSYSRLGAQVNNGGSAAAAAAAGSGNHQVQTVTDYAKPNKGVSTIQHSQITETTTRTLTERDQLDSMLGNLHADMSRQGVMTTQKGCCNACEKPIVGQVITALGKTWHPEHFTCNHCNQELGTRNFFERDGNPYCEPDYHNLFSPRCAYCNGAILDVSLVAGPGAGDRREPAEFGILNILLYYLRFRNTEMRDGAGEDVAHGSLFLCAVRPTVWRGGIP